MDHILNQNHGCVCTSQAQHRFKVAEELMDLIGPTEWQCGNPCNFWQQHKKAKDAGACRELSTQTGGHDHLIAKRVADRNIPVNGHGDQQDPLRIPKRMEEIHLQEAASNRDGLLFTDEIGEHLGNGGCGVPDLQKGKDTDEIIHGIVETGVQPYSKEDQQIPNDNKCIDEKQRKEVQETTILGQGKANEDEFSHC